MADTEIQAIKKISRGDKIIVTVESIIPDIIVVSFENGVESFQGALLDVNKRGLPCGINPPQPIVHRDGDKLAGLAARSTYCQEENSPIIQSSPKFEIRKNINASSKLRKACRPTVRLRPRQVLCNKCQSICNEQNENVGMGKKRKISDEPEEQENIETIPASLISRRSDRRSVIHQQRARNEVDRKIVGVLSTIPKIRRSDPTNHDNDNRNNQSEQNIRLCWLRSSAVVVESLQSKESEQYSNANSRQNSPPSHRSNDSSNGGNTSVVYSKPTNDVMTTEEKTFAAADSTIKNTLTTAGIQRTSRKRRSVGSMEDLWDENFFEDIIKSTSASQVTPVIKILFGTHGEGTVLKIPSKMKKSSENMYEMSEKYDQSPSGRFTSDGSLSSTGTVNNNESAESQTDVQKLHGKDVASTKAAKRALKKAKKEARQKIISGSDSVSPAQSSYNTSPRYNPTYDPLLYHRRKHKLKHKKKHKDDRKREDKAGLAPTTNEQEGIHHDVCKFFPGEESYTAIKEQCLKQKLSISLKRLNANAYTKYDYSVSNASSGCKSLDSSEELSELDQEKSLENNVDTTDNISHLPTSHPLAIRFAATPLAHCLTTNGRRMDVGDIVWGKIHGFPWWPGKVLSISASCQEDGSSGGAQAHVAWYGSSTCSLMSCDRLSPFLETFKARYNKKKRGPYKEAIRQAQSEAQTQMSVDAANGNVTSACEPSRETKQLGVGMKINGDDEMERALRIETPVPVSNRIPSSLNVTAVDVVLSPAVCHSSPSHSILTLTPGRTRNIDQDMEALRLSRQDNPFLQILASRESLIESIDESESDDAILMSQELGDADPLTLAQVHEHLVRSPPPASWPHAPTFAFNTANIHCGNTEPLYYKDSPSKINYYKERTSDTSLSSRSEPPNDIRDRQSHSFSLLNPTPIRTLSEVRRLHRSADDNVQLMSSE